MDLCDTCLPLRLFDLFARAGMADSALAQYDAYRRRRLWAQDVLGAAHLLDDAGDLPGGELSIVIPWLLHHRVDAAGSTLAGEWRRAQRRIEPDDLLLLDAYDSAWMSIWEVAEVEKGRGSRLTDVLTGQQRFIEDVSSTATLERFDTLLATTIDCDGRSFFGGLHAQPLPPRFGSAATAAAKRLCRVRTRPVAPDRLRNPETELNLMFLWRTAVQRMLDQPPPVIQTTDGEPLVFTRADFAPEAPRDAIIRRIAALPGVQEPEQEDGETVFVVTKPGNALHRSWSRTIIGRIVLKKDRLFTETMSTQRADALRVTMEKEFRGLVRFRLRKEENTADLVRTTSAATAASPSESRDPRRPRPAEPYPP